MKIFLSLLFLLIFGLFVLLATVDLEPYFNGGKETASGRSPHQTHTATNPSAPNADTTQSDNDGPSKITTHRLIVTNERIEMEKNEQTDSREPPATALQEAADPVVDSTSPAPPPNNRP